MVKVASCVCLFAVILLVCDKLLDYCCFGCWFWVFVPCCGLVWLLFCEFDCLRYVVGWVVVFG